MMNKNTNSQRPEFTLFHLIIFGIFLVSLVIRIYGAGSVNLSNSESEVLLSLAKIKESGSTTLFYGLLIRILQFFGVNSDLGIRFVNVIMGALITIFPALFYQEIGKRTAIIASLLLSFDPFGIANSIIFTGNITTLLLLGLILNAILHERNNLTPLMILLIIGHGRGLGSFVIIAILFLFILFFVKKDLFSNSIKFIKDSSSKKINIDATGSAIILIMILAVIFKLPLSNIATDVSNFVSGWGGNYQAGNYPIVYIFAIISSIPFAVVTLLVYFLYKTGEEDNIKVLSFIWLTLTLLIVMFYPEHLMIDLIWMSLPICILAAFIIEKFIAKNIQLFREEGPFLAILFFMGISLGLNLISFVYRSIWGLDVTNFLLAILFIGIFAIVLCLYKAFISSVSKAISSLVIVLLVFGGITQLSISARAAAINNKPENEILWNGYFEGEGIVTEILNTTKTSLTGTLGKLNVFIDGEVKPVVIITAKSEKIYFQESDLLSIRPEVIISNDKSINLREDIYQGQEVVSNSYPLWTWDPVGSFFSTDYWNWFFFRNNLQYKEYNFIWTNKTLMINKIDNGAN